MPNIDIFNDEAFSLQTLTAAVNKIPFVPGQIGKTKIFSEKGVSTTSIWVELQNGTLRLIEPTLRGGPGETKGDNDREAISFKTDHFQRDDAVLADEVQNVRSFGSESELEQVQDRVNQKIAGHTSDLDATLEHQRLGAIKGIIVSKSGRVLHNLYTKFNIAPPAPIVMGLSTATTKIRTKCFDVLNPLEDELDGAEFKGVHAFCGKAFWIKLIDHPNVRETYLNYVEAAELRGSPNAFKFDFGGITWERYRTGKQAAASAGGAFIADDEARVVPLGVKTFSSQDSLPRTTMKL